jgi:hypothetical protein
MPQEPKKRAPSLEREAFAAVVLLYMFITALVLAFHFLPLDRQEGAAATSSPHHQEQGQEQEQERGSEAP